MMDEPIDLAFESFMNPIVFLIRCTIPALAIMSSGGEDGAQTPGPKVANPAAPVTKSPPTRSADRKARAKEKAPAPLPPLIYRLADGNERWDPEIRRRILESMDGAVAIYNELGVFPKALTVNYNPGVATAEGNSDGYITFGGQISKRTALHEIAHTLGVGQHERWADSFRDGKWTGPEALAQIRQFDGPDAVLFGDRQHFWPYGLNQENESSPESDRRHVRMVAALRRDLGLAPPTPMPSTKSGRRKAKGPPGTDSTAPKSKPKTASSPVQQGGKP